MGWNEKPVFPKSLKPLFLQFFSKCSFTFCLVCGCYFRNVSCVRGAPLTSPARVRTHQNAHKFRCTSPSLQPLPQQLSVFISGEPLHSESFASSFSVQWPYNLHFHHLPSFISEELFCYAKVCIKSCTGKPTEWWMRNVNDFPIAWCNVNSETRVQLSETDSLCSVGDLTQ